MSWSRAILWAFFASSYFWSIGGANAAGVDPKPFYVANGFQVIGNAIARHLPFTFSPSAAGGSTASLPVPAKVGNVTDVPFVMKRTANWAGLLKIAGRTLPLVGNATAVYDLAHALRCQWNGQGIECDEGTTPNNTTQTVTEWFDSLASNVPARYSRSLSGACTASMTLRPLCTSDSTKSCTSQSVTGTSGTVRCLFSYSYTIISGPDFQQCNNTVPKSCNQSRTDVRDMATRQVQIQVPSCTAGPDGKCEGGSKIVLTPEDFSSRFSPLFPPTAGTQPTGTPAPADVARDAWNTGQDIGNDFGPIEITGPVSTTGQPTTTTVTTPGGTPSTTTVQNVYNYTYQGDKVTWTTTTKTTKPDGTVEETTDAPGTEIPTPNDPAMPAQPSLYTRKYPQGLVGVWNEKSVALKQTPIFAFLQQLVPNTGDGGCPQWSIPTGNVLGIMVGGDVSIPCFVWSAIRLIMIIGALLLARALIFGG